jgi:hypothetical protein
VVHVASGGAALEGDCIRAGDFVTRWISSSRPVVRLDRPLLILPAMNIQGSDCWRNSCNQLQLGLVQNWGCQCVPDIFAPVVGPGGRGVRWILKLAVAGEEGAGVDIMEISKRGDLAISPNWD